MFITVIIAGNPPASVVASQIKSGMLIHYDQEGPNEWKTSDTNPEGMCLKLRLSLGQYKFVFDDIPQHLGWRAKQLAAALGTGPDGETLELTPEDLIDQVVRVDISTYHSKAGKTSSVVKKYLPAAAASDKPKPAKKAPKLQRQPQLSC